MKILDHGELKYIEHYGSDERIIEAARMSTDGGFRGWDAQISADACPQCHGKGKTDDRGFALEGQPMFDTMACPLCGGDGRKRSVGDGKLLRYLWENKHATPFEMAGMVIEVKAPILVFRQWHRHRTQSYNEMSARYTPIPDEHYLPTAERCIPPVTQNKQARGATDRIPTTAEVTKWRADVKSAYDVAEAVYQNGLKIGVPKEVARVTMPVARYSRMRANANLRNWLAFLTLRMDSHAQYEIRVYAEALGKLMAEHYPRTWALFEAGRKS